MLRRTARKTAHHARKTAHKARRTARSVGVASVCALASLSGVKADMVQGVFGQAGRESPAQTHGVFYFSPSSLTHWQSAMQRVTEGRGRARVVFLGDSKDRGAGAGGASADGMYCDRAEPHSKPARFAGMLSEVGVSATHQSWMGSGALNSTAEISVYDPRLAFGTSWSIGSNSLGGSFIDTNGTDSLTFRPEGRVDHVDIYTKAQPGGGVLTVTVDGNPNVLATIDGNGVDALVRTPVDLGSPGEHTISIQRTRGGPASVLGMVAQDSTAPAVDVINAGAIGTMSSYHADLTGPGSAWSSANTLAVQRPDLVLIQLGSNDMNGNVPVATYRSNLQTLISRAKEAGADVVLEVATFGQEGRFGSDAMRAAYRDTLLELGRSNGVIVVDHASMFGTYAAAKAMGLMRDDIHESAQGYMGEARVLVSAVAGGTFSAIAGRPLQVSEFRRALDRAQ